MFCVGYYLLKESSWSRIWWKFLKHFGLTDSYEFARQHKYLTGLVCFVIICVWIGSFKALGKIETYEEKAKRF